MTRKFTQEEVATYFKEQGYTLLSEYKGANEKVSVRNRNGELYEVTLNGFKHGHRPDRGGSYTQEEVANYFKEHGYTLLSEYTRMDYKVKIRNSNGDEYFTRLNNFKAGARPENRSIPRLTIEEVRQYLHNEGYTLISTRYVNNTSKLSITCPHNHTWEVSYTSFRNGQRCPECKPRHSGGMSMGERVVWTVIQNNLDTLQEPHREVTVYIKGKAHRFDFTFTCGDREYVVEYDGSQHYSNSSKVFKNPKQRDRIKDDYCKQNNITLIRVPYTLKTLVDITEYLSDKVGVTLSCPSMVNIPTMKEVADYYLTHSRDETAVKFNVSGSTVTTYFKTLYGTSKREYVRQQD